MSPGPHDFPQCRTSSIRRAPAQWAAVGALALATAAAGGQAVQPVPRVTDTPRVEQRSGPIALPPGAYAYNVIEVVSSGGPTGSQQVATAECAEGQRVYSAGFTGLILEPIYSGETVEAPPSTILGAPVPGTGGPRRAITGYRHREVLLSQVASEPAPDGRSWIVRAVFVASGGGSWQLRVRAVCGNPPR